MRQGARGGCVPAAQHQRVKAGLADHADILLAAKGVGWSDILGGVQFGHRIALFAR
jgi:hypothetical protein